MALQASTWSRVRHSPTPGQLPLRQRQQPLGFSELHPEASDKVLLSNAETEVCCWFLEQAARCSTRFVNVMLVFPEDLGGDAEIDPSSIWDFQEVHAVDGVNDIHCQLAGSNQRRPLGLYTNLCSLQSRMYRGWPSLFPLGSHLHYDGPDPPLAHALPRTLHSKEWTCARSSTPLLKSTALGEQFRWWCVVPFLDFENASHRVGGTAHAACSGPVLATQSQWYPVRPMAWKQFDTASLG